MNGGRRRVAVLIDNAGPYHVARLAAAAALNDVELIEASPAQSEYDWRKPDMPDAIGYIPLAGAGDATALARLLDARAIDALALPGWSTLTTLRCLQWARARRIPAILMSESNAWDFPRRRAAERLKRGVVALFAAGLVTSDSQADYLASLGLPRAALFRGYNAIDNDYFAIRAAAVRVARTLPDIGGTRLPEAAFGRCFLSSARFVEKKNLCRLLEGYAAFRRARPADPADWPLILLGDGPQRDALTRLRGALDLDAHVHFPGFRQIDELPSYYGAAGAFVLASVVEQWGLVVNEAMASALPVAVSRRCGCAEMLVEDGVTGVTFDPFSPADIAAALESLVALPDLAAMGRAAQRRVADWGPARFAEGLDRAVRYALEQGPPPARLANRLALAAAIGQRAALGRGLLRPHRLG